MKIWPVYFHFTSSNTCILLDKDSGLRRHIQTPPHHRPVQRTYTSEPSVAVKLISIGLIAKAKAKIRVYSMSEFYEYKRESKCCAVVLLLGATHR